MQYHLHFRKVMMALMLLVAFTLAVTGTAMGAGLLNDSNNMVVASSPCPPGTACCVETSACGWCEGPCILGGKWLYTGWYKICYDAQGNQTSFDSGCIQDFCSWSGC